MSRKPRVIVGVGETEHGTRPLAWAIAEARRRHADLHAIRVWRNVGPPAPAPDGWQPYLRITAASELGEAFMLASAGMPPDISVLPVTIEGRVAPTLTAYANREDDLLVLGQGRPRRFFTSRVVRQCVRTAACPVTVVPLSGFGSPHQVRKLLRDLNRDLLTFERA